MRPTWKIINGERVLVDNDTPSTTPAAVQQQPLKQEQQQQSYGATGAPTAPTVAADLEQPPAAPAIAVQPVQPVQPTPAIVQQQEQAPQVMTQQTMQQISQEGGAPVAAGAAGGLTTPVAPVTIVDANGQPQQIAQQQQIVAQQPPVAAAAATTISITPGAPQMPPEQQPLMQSFHTNPVAGSYFVDNPAAAAAFAQYQAEQQRQREEAAAKNKRCLIVVIVVLLCVLCIGGGGFGCYYGGFIGGDDGFFESEEVMTTNKQADRAVRVIYYNDVDPDLYKYWKTSSYDAKCRQEEIISMNCSPKEFIEYRQELIKICGYLNACDGLKTKSPALIIGFLKRMKNSKPVNAFQYGKYTAALRELFDESNYYFNGQTIEKVLDRIEAMSCSHSNWSCNGGDSFLEWKNCFKALYAETSNDSFYSTLDVDVVIRHTRYIAEPLNGNVLWPDAWAMWKGILKQLYYELQEWNYTYSGQSWITIANQTDTIAGLKIQSWQFSNRWCQCKRRYEQWRRWNVPQAINMVRNTR